MQPDRFKPLLIRDKNFLEELYQSSSRANSKRILQFAGDAKLKTLIIFLHLLSSGDIEIKKQNFEKLEKRHLTIFRSIFEKKAAYKKLLDSEREQKLKVIFKLVTVLHFLLHTLFNED